MTRYFALLFCCVSLSAQDLKIASIGDLQLDGGEVIRDCKIGYRIYGAGNEKTIVVTTWFGGTTASLASSIGPGRLFDSSRYRMIAIDALGDGVSSSPAHITIRDMVRSQYELLTHELHINHVYAVAGLSMGGMQTFQWLASYPDFMDKAVAIAGTPKMTSYDLVLWKTQLGILESGAANAMDIIADINTMHLNTPSFIATHTKPEAVDDYMRSREASVRSIHRDNYTSQLRALIAHDTGPISKPKAKVLVVVSLQDQMVNPAPAREFARSSGADLVTLSGDCGHLATACEIDLLTSEVHRFLE
jgi:homoserine O-acetyltransferase